MTIKHITHNQFAYQNCQARVDEATQIKYIFLTSLPPPLMLSKTNTSVNVNILDPCTHERNNLRVNLLSVNILKNQKSEILQSIKHQTLATDKR